MVPGSSDDLAPTIDLPRRRFTVEEYELMGRTGVIGPDERTELLDGEIVFMSPIGPPHASVVDVAAREFYRRLLDRAAIRVQNPVRLLPHSEPQPDIVLARLRQDDYRGSHPTAEDTLLVVEVADSSLATDRAIKLPIYAREGIPEVWIVDLKAGVVHVWGHLSGGTYRDVRVVQRGQSLAPAAFPDAVIDIDTILG